MTALSETLGPRGNLGQMHQRGVQMLPAERRESDALPRRLRDRRPVIGQPDLRRGRSNRGQVVAPNQTANVTFPSSEIWPGSQEIASAGRTREPCWPSRMTRSGGSRDTSPPGNRSFGHGSTDRRCAQNSSTRSALAWTRPIAGWREIVHDSERSCAHHGSQFRDRQGSRTPARRIRRRRRPLPRLP